ncbi:MAG: hypothetical protein ABEI78_01710 [Candidatus Nanohaloarchaea archaeon]
MSELDYNPTKVFLEELRAFKGRQNQEKKDAGVGGASGAVNDLHIEEERQTAI